METLSRRRFLEVMSTLTGGLLLGCSTLGAETSRVPNAPPTIAYQLSPGKKRLIDAVSALTESPIKDAVVDRALPYFTNTLPWVITRSDLEIKVTNSTVNTQPTKAVGNPPPLTLKGEFNYRSFLRPEAYATAERTTMLVPFIGPLKEEEKEDIPKENITPDGTVLINLTIPENDPVPDGVRPIIVIETNNRSYLSAQGDRMATNLENLAFVKEAISLMLMEVQMEEMYRKMVILGLPTTMNVKDRAGKLLQVNATYPLLEGLQSNKGRTVAVVDLASYLVALKASEGMEANSFMAQRSHQIRDFFNAGRDFNLGTTATDIFYNSTNWVLNNRPISTSVFHAGEFEPVP